MASARLLAVLAWVFLAASCHRAEETQREPPPPPATTPAPGASGGVVNACAGGGGQDTDPISAPLVPRLAGGFCLDPQSEPKTYGDQGKLSMDDVCTTAFDGECEVYKRFGLERVVVLHYVDGSGAPSSVEGYLSRFKTADGAYGMFTKRVVADGDPARATVKPLSAGAAAAMSSSNAYVWRGAYLVELTFVTEDSKMTPEVMARENERSTGAIAKAIGEKLPAAPTLPPSALALPAASRIPLGIAYYPKDAPALGGIGPVAVGYYTEVGKRWRDVAIVRSDGEAAKEAFRAFKRKSVGAPTAAAKAKGLGDEDAVVVLQEGADRPKVEYLVARKGNLVAAIGDEELLLNTASPDEMAALNLTRDEKASRLAAWLAGPP
jgi:hypothetical protein